MKSQKGVEGRQFKAIQDSGHLQQMDYQSKK